MVTFDFYEIVRVASRDPALRDVLGLEGAIAGIAEDHDGQPRSYAVCLYAREEVSVFNAEHLEATGRIDWQEAACLRPTIRVAVDPVTFEGSIVTDDGTS